MTQLFVAFLASGYEVAMAKPNYPNTSEERAKVYLHCMAEIKKRLLVIEKVSGEDMQTLFANEICYLELRFICELIAIACLTAQGDFKTQRAFTEEYSPPKIFAALREIYPQFFPKDAEVISEPGRHHVQSQHKPDAYGESDIVSLWHQAGTHLHRASVNHYLKKTFKSPPDLSSVRDHVVGIVRLLESHILPIQTNLDYPLMLLVHLEDGDDGIEANFLHLDPDKGTIWFESYTTKLVERR